jgi:hypothetical protein
MNPPAAVKVTDPQGNKLLLHAAAGLAGTFLADRTRGR